ncbi:hypothetical protein PROFUN_00931 [Planoprotostelium fungivorum]|uniref:Ubiquitin-like domain-containing protein n=1 Tax=Planoprotostelium fungivorum TaxID=1890364 RepID=A0A2P6N476_9EUKA|nr:hypothetical protein PROFUN_00931 [Planoprotostelium fungivorum]
MLCQAKIFGPELTKRAGGHPDRPEIHRKIKFRWTRAFLHRPKKRIHFSGTAKEQPQTNNMTVKIVLTATGETFEAQASDVQQLKDEIYEQKGVPQSYQMFKDASGAVMNNDIADGSTVNLSFHLKGGCEESCGCCGCQEECCCTII